MAFVHQDLTGTMDMKKTAAKGEMQNTAVYFRGFAAEQCNKINQDMTSDMA